MWETSCSNVNPGTRERSGASSGASSAPPKCDTAKIPGRAQTADHGHRGGNWCCRCRTDFLHEIIPQWRLWPVSQLYPIRPSFSDRQQSEEIPPGSQPGGSRSYSSYPCYHRINFFNDVSEGGL